MLDFIRNLITNRLLIWKLAKSDFKNRYLGSYLGITWGFIQPAITILIYWFVFQIGFKSVPVEDFPFVLWLLAGIVPWFFIAESLTSTTNSIVENSFLVKKMVFQVNILPVIKIVSALAVHLFFILVLFLMYFIYGYDINVHHLQVLYYLFCTIMLVLSISFITSSLNVFLKDTGQFVTMIIQIFFWVTPIFWSLNIVPEKYRIFLKMNPVYYIVEGYRDTFIYQKWFWHHPFLTPYFWFVVIILTIIGVKLFKKLQVHFADVL